jgi:2,5-diamino-6-(ribosylamino)-4(3H)-pyrimidinone 5'-phosphate reductase
VLPPAPWRPSVGLVEPPSGRGRPRVVVHAAVSLDGATTGFTPAVGLFYELAATWDEDVTLTGADTILAQEPALATAAQPGPSPSGPLLVVVDSRARVSHWTALRDAGHWSDVLAVSSERTPPRPDAVQELVVGRDRVDLPALLGALGRSADVVRVDSGGALTGALLAEGLVDEISLLVHPVLTGGQGWWGAGSPAPTSLTLIDCREAGDGLVWSRYATGT